MKHSITLPLEENKLELVLCKYIVATFGSVTSLWTLKSVCWLVGRKFSWVESQFQKRQECYTSKAPIDWKHKEENIATYIDILISNMLNNKQKQQ